jgi:hypothetical protein
VGLTFRRSNRLHIWRVAHSYFAFRAIAATASSFCSGSGLKGMAGAKYRSVMLSEAKHLICFRGEPIKNDQRFFASLRMTS